MNKFVKGLAAALVTSASALGCSSYAQAAPVNIVDEYMGGIITNSSGNPTSYNQRWDGTLLDLDNNGTKETQFKDVVGDPATFGILGAEVEQQNNGADLRIKINTNYANETGALGTSYGSLFIGEYDETRINNIFSNNSTDTFTAGNNEERFAYSLYMPPEAPDNFNGTSNLYKLDGDGSDVEKSAANGTHRHEQAVRPIISGSNAATDTGLDGTWNIEDGYLEFVIAGFFTNQQIAQAINPLDGIVFGWAMSCANDVIFGAVPGGNFANPVPLPGGLILLLSGLLGVGWLGRSRARLA